MMPSNWQFKGSFGYLPMGKEGVRYRLLLLLLLSLRWITAGGGGRMTPRGSEWVTHRRLPSKSLNVFVSVGMDASTDVKGKWEASEGIEIVLKLVFDFIWFAQIGIEIWMGQTEIVKRSERKNWKHFTQ